MKLTTVRVDDGDGDYVVINESDFDPSEHTIFGQKQKASTPPPEEPEEPEEPESEPEPETTAWPTTARALRDHISDAPAEELDAIELAENARDEGPRKTVTDALASARRDLGLPD